MASSNTKEERVPVILLSGFLGVGKTTLLRTLLTKTALQIACIVNDVASINIDSKLIRNKYQRDGSKDQNSRTTADLVDTIELQNGCVCCSLSDELFASLKKLIVRAKRKKTKYDLIVVENSGVAEPNNIRSQFHEAALLKHPLLERIYLKTMVTVVDSSRFFEEYYSRDTMIERPNLGKCSTLPIVELLIEQVECSDVIVLNKSDLLEEESMDKLQGVVHTLNPLAKILTANYGDIPFETIFNKDMCTLMSQITLEGQHRGAVSAAKQSNQAAGGTKHHHHHDHHHSHDHHHHDHHHHDQDHSDHHHNHDHHHDHHHHDQDHIDQAAEDKEQRTTASTRFGIESFVYERRRPFHVDRLTSAIKVLIPKAPNKSSTSTSTSAKANANANGHSVSNGSNSSSSPPSDLKDQSHIIRSKGFIWLSSAHDMIFYWSHANYSFDIVEEGEWWDSIPEDEWPADEAQREVIRKDFVGKHGDRKQEIIFIGVKMDSEMIIKTLDEALLSDEELYQYEVHNQTAAS